MDWMQVSRLLALGAGVVVLVALLVVATLVWSLNHPKD